VAVKRTQLMLMTRASASSAADTAAAVLQLNASPTAARRPDGAASPDPGADRATDRRTTRTDVSSAAAHRLRLGPAAVAPVSGILPAASRQALAETEVRRLLVLAEIRAVPVPQLAEETASPADDVERQPSALPRKWIDLERDRRAGSAAAPPTVV